MIDVEYADFFRGRLKLRHLVVIIMIVEEGTTIAAAERLHISQPAITRILREVEDILGVELFERTPKGMQMTAFTEPFLKQARAALSHIRTGVRHLQELADGESGHVYVGVHLSGAGHLLSSTIRRLKEESPHITVHVREANPSGLRSLISSGEIDFYISRFTESDPRTLPNGEPLHFEPMFREPISVVAAEDHPAVVAGHPLSLRELAEHKWVLPVKQTTLRKELDKAFSLAEVPRIEDVIECSTFTIMHDLVRQGKYLAVVPQTMYQLMDGVEALHVQDLDLGSHTGMVWAADSPLSPVVRRFQSLLLDGARRLREPL